MSEFSLRCEMIVFLSDGRFLLKLKANPHGMDRKFSRTCRHRSCALTSETFESLEKLFTLKV